MAVNLVTPQAAELLPVAGVRLGVAEAGIRKANRRDLTVIALAEGSRAAGVFTRNRFCAAPVQLCRTHLAGHAIRALVINTGVANAGTGEAGLAGARASCEAVAQALGVAAEQVLPFSTGVILEPLPVERLVAGLPRALADLRENGWFDAEIVSVTPQAKGTETLSRDENPLKVNPDKIPTLKAAFKAFKKRLKLTQLGEDSKLSRSPMTAGRRSDIIAIEPPNQFPPAVWEELVKQGKLKRAGHGMYELREEER